MDGEKMTKKRANELIKIVGSPNKLERLSLSELRNILKECYSSLMTDLAVKSLKRKYAK
jgi:hypothetical protein